MYAPVMRATMFQFAFVSLDRKREIYRRDMKNVSMTRKAMHVAKRGCELSSATYAGGKSSIDGKIGGAIALDR